MENNTTTAIQFSVDSGNCPTVQVVANDNLRMVSIKSAKTTVFAGVATNECFSRPMLPASYIDMLVKGFNNRTRERNYFRLYCDLLSNEISEDEFDAEIENNEDRYVVRVPEKTPTEEIYAAVCLSHNLLDVESTDDFSSTFSIDDKSIDNYVNLLCNG